MAHWGKPVRDFEDLSHDDIICNECGHHSDDHGSEGCDWGMYPGQLIANRCSCVGFDSIANAAERQGMQRMAQAANS